MTNRTIWEVSPNSHTWTNRCDSDVSVGRWSIPERHPPRKGRASDRGANGHELFVILVVEQIRDAYRAARIAPVDRLLTPFLPTCCRSGVGDGDCRSSDCIARYDDHPLLFATLLERDGLAGPPIVGHITYDTCRHSEVGAALVGRNRPPGIPIRSVRLRAGCRRRRPFHRESAKRKAIAR